VHAGQYSAVMHCLKVATAMGIDDPLFGKGKVRFDGHVIHDMYLFEV
jgi:hypothetical protein